LLKKLISQRKVAAHATTTEGIRNAILAGVDSIEHGHGADRADLDLMKSKGVYLVPTLSVIDPMVAKAPTMDFPTRIGHS